VMGFGDAFFVLTCFYVCLSLMVLMLDKPSNPASGGGGH
jgi:MFS transporter, DHA2 family, multidrug resistance protein